MIALTNTRTEQITQIPAGSFPCKTAKTFAILMLLACVVSSVRAQSFRGTIRGNVTDSTGAAVVGATVTAKNLANGDSRIASSGGEGGYVIPELVAGEYEVSAEAKDLVIVKQKAAVFVGLETTVNVTLGKVTGTSQRITVEAEAAPLIEPSQNILGEVIEERLVTELPLNGRDFGRLVALVPGATVEGSGVAGSEKGTGQFNINGNRDRSNNYTLDGTDNNDPFHNNSALNQVGISGAPATLLPLDSIQEFNLQGQFQAEYGRNSGSVVNIITKSGTNEVHGSAYEYLRNSFFDARNFFNPTGTPQSQFINNNFGGSFGAPIIRRLRRAARTCRLGFQSVCSHRSGPCGRYCRGPGSESSNQYGSDRCPARQVFPSKQFPNTPF
jgi:hypothetical protein